MSLPAAKELLQILEDLIQKKDTSLKSKLATVTQIHDNRPYVTFDGEADQSQMPYSYQTGLTFAVNDRVFMQATDSTYVIAYKITE